MMNKKGSDIKVTIDKNLFEKIDTGFLAQQLKAAAEQLLKSFLLEGNFEVMLSSSETAAVIIIHIDELKCYSPAYLTQQVYHYITNTHPPSLWEEDFLNQRLSDLSKEEITNYFAKLFEEILKCQPDKLVTENVIQLLIEKIFDSQQIIEKIFDSQQKTSFLLHLKKLIKKLVSHFIPIKSLPELTEQFNDETEHDRLVEKHFENLFSKWKNPFIELRFPEQYFRSLTLHSFNNNGNNGTPESNDEELFILMKDGLFYENGIIYPQVKITFSPLLPANSFQVGINNWSSLPIKAINTNQTVISTDQVGGLIGEPIFNISNGTVYYLLHESKKKEILHIQNRWSPMGYIILLMSQILRNHANWFVDNDFTAGILNKLEQLYPRLVGTAKEAEKEYRVTKVLRLLAAEEISIRDLGNILQQITDADAIEADEFSEIIFDSRIAFSHADEPAVISDPVNVCTYVRHHLKNYITSKYTRNSNNLNVLLLDREIEQLIIDNAVMPVEKEKILNGLRKERPSATSYVPVLTTSNIRPLVKELIKEEFPFLPVLSYRELSEHANIKVTGRVYIE